jgi:hypothetical protein
MTLIYVEEAAEEEAGGADVAAEFHHCPVHAGAQNLFELSQDDLDLGFSDLGGDEGVFGE